MSPCLEDFVCGGLIHTAGHVAHEKFPLGVLRCLKGRAGPALPKQRNQGYSTQPPTGRRGWRPRWRLPCTPKVHPPRVAGIYPFDNVQLHARQLKETSPPEASLTRTYLTYLYL